MSNENAQALVGRQRVVISQVKEMLEIFAGFETKNKYRVVGEGGEELFYAAETSTGLFSVLLRLWLKAARPFTMQVIGRDGSIVLKLHRPFRFVFHRLEISDGQGHLLGVVQKRWSWVRRIYDVLDGQDNARLRLFGPLFRPWTFEVRKGEAEAGLIQKKWSGALKEMFTDADNFALELGDSLDLDERTLLLGAVFLIDFVHFENRGR